MIRCKNFYFCYLLLLFFSFQIVSFGSNLHHDYSISTFSVDEGLSQSTVLSIFQDSEGFIWMGTRGGGLNRFDGQKFDVFLNQLNDTTTLSDNEVISIFEDSQDVLWVGTRNGNLNRFDKDKRNFVRYQLDSTEIIAVKYMFEDENADLFLGTYRGLFYKPDGGDRFERYSADADQLEIKSIVALDNDLLLIGASTGIYKLDKRTRKCTVIVGDPSVGFSTDGVTNVPIVIDKMRNIWFGTQSGLYVFADSEMKDVVKNPYGIDLLDNTQIRTLYEDQNGFFWIGLSNGLLKLNPETGDYIVFKPRANDPNSLSHHSIFSFLEDRNGNFWVGTWGGGATFLGLLPPKFKHYFYIPNVNSISDNIVSSFAEVNEGVWIGTEGGGLNFFRPSNESFSKFSEETGLSLGFDHIKSLYVDNKQMLWIGTWGAGVFRYNPRENKLTKYLDEKRIYAFCENPKGQMWIGTFSGLYRLDYENNQLFEYSNLPPKGIQTSFVTTIFKDSRGLTWIGTREGGLYLYNKLKDEFINYSYQKDDPNSLIDNYVICITEDNQGDLWIGTNRGICKFNYTKGLFADMTDSIVLPSNVINGIVIDENSNLWISTNQGITKYNSTNEEIRQFDVRDGLQSNEFNRGAFFTSSDNTIYFGGIKGFNSFNPGLIQFNEVAPEVVLTNFKLFDENVLPGDKNGILKERISKTEEIVLQHKHSIFTIDFVALNFNSSEKNRYRYMLEGYNNNWIDIGHQNSVSFMNLRDGKYTFRVIASNNDNVWNETGASLKITILPPLWRSNWATAGYFVLILLLVFFFYKLILWRLKERNRIVNEKLEKERTEELNQMKLKFFTNITHEFKTPLTLITAPLDNLMSEGISTEKKEYYYKLIKGNITRLKSLGNQLIDFRKAEQEYYKPSIRPGNLKDFIKRVSENFTDFAEHKKIDFKVEIPDNEEATQWFDKEILEKILFNLLSNAFKFTPEGGSVTVAMSFTKKLATIIVKDNGIGISEDELPFIFDRFFTSKIPERSHYSGTGIGLSFAKRLTEVHHGSIDVKSHMGFYTEFSLTIPVNKESYSNDELIDVPGIDDALKAEKPVYLEPVIHEFAQDDDEEHENQKIMLVVEDNEEIAHYLVNQFSDDFKVYRASNGSDGYEMVREFIPDIIISDIMMDKMTGLELCTKVKNDIITTHIPVILLTVLVSDNNKIDGLEMGADAYVEKPFEINYLRTVVNNLLKQRAALKEKYLLENINSIGNLSNNPDSKFLSKVEEIIENHFSDPDFSINTLSEKLNVSRSQLFRKFRSVTGKSPGDIIRVVRLKKAAEIILRGDMGVNEVAYEVGFSSPSHFISIFKKYFGKTPKEYSSTHKPS
jgi:signal transduction histidine kinase/ligand-binding sensor domain-containing protein/DNA-binding response OmpR family regulator